MRNPTNSHFTKFLSWFIAFSLAGAQTQGLPPNENSPRQVLIARAKDLLSSVPAELSSDARIKLVQMGAFATKREQIEQLQSAFSLAGQSPYPAKMTFISGDVDTLSGYLADTYTLDFDQISLQDKAVSEMLKVDPTLALDMFREIGPLKLPPRTCSDTLAYDVKSYYRTAGQVYRRAFDSVEIADGDRTVFLDAILSSISNPAQLVPALELLIELKPDASDLSRVEAVLARAMSNVEFDPRSFGVIDRMLSLDLYQLEALYQGDNRLLLQAVKLFVESSLAHEVCKDDVFLGELANAKIGKAADSKEFAGLNQLLSKYEIAPIRPGNLRPASLGPRRSQEESYWKSARANELLEEFQRTRDDQARLGPASADWQHEVTQMLTALDEWDESDDSARRIMVKAILYKGTVEMIPTDSPVFKDCLGAYVQFLSTPPPTREVEMFWLWNINALTKRLLSRKRPQASRQAQRIESALAGAPNPTIALTSLIQELEHSQ